MRTGSIARSATLGCVALCVPAMMAGQERQSSVWRGVHRDAQRPSYEALALLAGAPPISEPPAPSEDGTWRGVHRDADRPAYDEDRPRLAIGRIALPPPPVGHPPAVVRGLYVNAWIFGSGRLEPLIRLADTTEINAFVIDVKDGTGYLTYRSSVPTAIEIGANGLVRAPDVRERLARLRQHGVHPIARIVVAKDPLLANGKPNWAVSDTRGGLWADRIGHHWVDAYRDSVWMYAADLAEEAVLMGFAEIQFDYIRFPDEPAERMTTAIFPARREGQSRRSAVTQNLGILRDRVQALGVPFTVDIFGLTTSATTDMGIGQYWDDIASQADVVLPMVYPSHYGRGAYGIPFPNAEPYAVVRRALEDGVARNRQIANAATIRPFLQSFSIRRVRYGAAEIRAQIEATYDLGLTDWILWNASGRYPSDAFLPRAQMASPPDPEDGPTLR